MHRRLTAYLAAAALASCTPAAPAALGAYRTAGRFDVSSAAGPRFDWPGSAVSVRFEGTSLSVELTEEQRARYAVTLDGAALPALSTGAGRRSYAVAAGLAPGPHELTLARETEALWGVTQLHGFAGSRLLDAPRGPARLIEIIGDSISCGAGVLSDTAACGITFENESESLAYGALAAAALRADRHTIARSGAGVLRNHDGATEGTLPALYSRTLAQSPTPQWSFAGPAPDVVVVHLGTNDFVPGDPGPAFVDAYEALLMRVRVNYPAAPVIVALSPMLSGALRTAARGYLESVVARAVARGDSRVSLVEFAEATADEGYGCEYHPSRATHRRMAATLVEAIRRVTGW